MGGDLIAAALIQTPERSRLEAMLAEPSQDATVLATALGLAFFLGAAHALTPGHGKAIVAAYLAGTRGRLTDAVYLGSVVTVTHTACVFALGLAALYASRHVSLDRIYPGLALLSGVLVSLIGLVLLRKRLRMSRSLPPEPDHNHPHRHSHSSARPERGSLLSLGVSGGLVPCPEALVVLMLSVSLGRIAFGLLVLVAFSLGLAAVLIAIGSAMVLATPLAAKLTGESRWLRSLPVASAAVVTLLGVLMVAQSATMF